MAVLKLDKHNDKKEIEFELDYLASLTTKQRFEMMFRKTEEMLSLLNSPLGAPRAATGKRNEHRKATEIIKREPS
jgi:hypothetical protein